MRNYIVHLYPERLYEDMHIVSVIYTRVCSFFSPSTDIYSRGTQDRQRERESSNAYILQL